MSPQDTHCPRCGDRLKPLPSFTLMLWLCPCGGQTKPRYQGGYWTLSEVIKLIGKGAVVVLVDKKDHCSLDWRGVKLQIITGANSIGGTLLKILSPPPPSSFQIGDTVVWTSPEDVFELI